MQEIAGILEKPNIHFTIDKDEEDCLQCLAFCTEQQKDLGKA